MAPESMSRVQRKVRTLRAPMQQMSRTADDVERTVAGDSTTAPAAAVKSPAWIKQPLERWSTTSRPTSSRLRSPT
jgi:hypothetical protein